VNDAGSFWFVVIVILLKVNIEKNGLTIDMNGYFPRISIVEFAELLKENLQTLREAF